MSEKLASTPVLDQNIHNAEVSLSPTSREFLDGHGKLQVAVYDFATNAVEQFKLAAQKTKEIASAPQQATRELAISQARLARQRAKARVDSAKFAKLKNKRQPSLDAAEKHLNQLEQAEQKHERSNQERRDAIRRQADEKRLNNLATQTKRYQQSLTRQALSHEDMNVAERFELVDELSDEQLASISTNALRSEIIKRRLDRVDSKLRLGVDDDEAERLAATRDKLQESVKNSERGLADAIAQSLSDTSKSETKKTDDVKSTESTGSQSESADDKEDTESVQEADIQTDAPSVKELAELGSNYSKGDNPPKSAEVAKIDSKSTEATYDNSSDRPLNELDKRRIDVLSALEKRQDQLLAEQQLRTELLTKLEVVSRGASFRKEASRKDDFNIGKLTTELYGDDIDQFIVENQSFGTWVDFHKDEWDKLSTDKQNALEDAWPLVVKWYK